MLVPIFCHGFLSETVRYSRMARLRLRDEGKTVKPMLLQNIHAPWGWSVVFFSPVKILHRFDSFNRMSPLLQRNHISSSSQYSVNEVRQSVSFHEYILRHEYILVKTDRNVSIFVQDAWADFNTGVTPWICDSRFEPISKWKQSRLCKSFSSSEGNPWRVCVHSEPLHRTTMHGAQRRAPLWTLDWVLADLKSLNWGGKTKEI